jgi:hypothetical protein
METRRHQRVSGSPRRGATAIAVAVLIAAAGGADGRAWEGGQGMRIEMHTEGGIAYFPGLARPAVVDVDGLPAAEAGRLRTLVERALAAPPPAAPPAGAADYRKTFIAIDDGGTRRELMVTDLDQDPARRALLDALRELRGSAGGR